MPEYELYSYEEIARAFTAIRWQHVMGEPLTWTGPDRLHYTVSATSQEPSWHFSPEGMDYHRENDRDFWDVYTMVAVQIGAHQGAVRMEKSDTVRKMQEMIERLRAERPNLPHEHEL